MRFPQNLIRRAILLVLTSAMAVLSAGVPAMAGLGTGAPAPAMAVLSTGASASALPARPGKPPPFTVFVAGDSTASIYAAAEAPRTGWGQALPLFLHHDVRVVDEAISGASSKSFIALGGLGRIASAIGPGDYLLISFGHNDEKITDPERGTDPYTTFQEYLTQYVETARAHGATPILVTPVERRRFSGTTAVASHGEYPAAMKQLAQRLSVATIDLTALSLNLWQDLGPEATKNQFLWLAPGQNPNYPAGVSDNTHFRARGALEVARLVARQLKTQHLVHPCAVIRLGDALDESAVIWPAERPTSKPAS